MTNKSTVLELFNLLDKGMLEKNKILEYLKIKVPTFYKNIQKLKEAGFEVKNTRKLYYIEKYKNILEIDNNEKSIIAYLLYIAFRYLPKYKFNKFKTFIKKFLLLTEKADYKEIQEKFELIKKYFLIEEYEEKINILETYISENKKIKMFMHSGKIIFAKPVRFDWKKEKITLYYINIKKDKEEKLNIEQIAKIENYFDKSYVSDEEELIFELYGTLAKKYLLKKEERIIKNKKDSIIIASKINDKKALFKRLLRYDTLCKILYPQKEVIAFNKLIDEAIINIGFDKQNE